MTLNKTLLASNANPPSPSQIFERSLLSSFISAHTPNHFNLENFSSPILDSTAEIVLDPSVNYNTIKLNCYDDNDSAVPRSRSRSIISNSLRNCLKCGGEKRPGSILERGKLAGVGNGHEDFQRVASLTNVMEIGSNSEFNKQSETSLAPNNDMKFNSSTGLEDNKSNNGAGKLADNILNSSNFQDGPLSNNEVRYPGENEVENVDNASNVNYVNSENSFNDKVIKDSNNPNSINFNNDFKSKINFNERVFSNDKVFINNNNINKKEDVTIDFFSFADMLHSECNGRERTGSCYTVSAKDYIGT